MATIIGLSGSLRRGSFNTMLLRAAGELLPPGMALEIASIRDIPLYDADLDAAGPLPQVVALKDRMAAAAGLLIATPEYNHSLPGVLKNAIDWASRPATDIPRVFGGRPVAVMGVAAGQGATILAQAAWLPVFRALGMAPWFGGRMVVANARPLFNETGLIDEPTRARLDTFIKGFATFVAERRSAR